MALITSDVRRFHLKHLFGMVLSFAVALACLKYFPTFGIGAIAIVTVFWAGFGFLFASDTIDPGPIDARNWISQMFNLSGLALIIVSFLAAIVWLLIGAVITASGRFVDL